MLTGNIEQNEYILAIDILRAEHMPPMDVMTLGIDGYVKAYYGANSVCTSTSSHGINPVWNECLKVAAFLPSTQRTIKLEVWDANFLERHDLVGTINIELTDLLDEEDG